MATIISLEHTEVKIGGLTIRGFSSDADSLTLPDIEGVTVDRNALGTMMGMTTGNKGGPVTIKLQASAPELKELYGWVGETINGTPRIFQGSVRNVPYKFAYSLASGLLTTWPAGITMGAGSVNSFMFVFEFERITPNYQESLLGEAISRHRPIHVLSLIPSFPR